MKQTGNSDYMALWEKLQQVFDDEDTVREYRYDINTYVGIRYIDNPSMLAEIKKQILSEMVSITESKPFYSPIINDMLQLALQDFFVDIFSMVKLSLDTIEKFCSHKKVDDQIQIDVKFECLERIIIKFLRRLLSRMGYLDAFLDGYNSLDDIMKVMLEDGAVQKYRDFVDKENELLYYGILYKSMELAVSDKNIFHEIDIDVKKIYEKIWNAGQNRCKNIMQDDFNKTALDVLNKKFGCNKKFNSIDDVMNDFLDDKNGSVYNMALLELNEPFLSFREECKKLIGKDAGFIFQEVHKERVSFMYTTQISSNKIRLDELWKKRNSLKISEWIGKYMSTLIAKERIPYCYYCELNSFLHMLPSSLIDKYMAFCDHLAAVKDPEFTKKTTEYLYAAMIDVLSDGMHKRGYQGDFSSIQDMVKMLWQQDKKMSADVTDYFIGTYSFDADRDIHESMLITMFRYDDESSDASSFEEFMDNIMNKIE